MSRTEGLQCEFGYIEWVRSRTAPDPRVPVGIGDDAAVIRLTPGRELLLTTDMILEGIHFNRTRTTARLIGRKALAVNLSDIAAMAGVPLAAVVSVGMPGDFAREDAEELFAGMKELADEFHVAIVGGDTNRSHSGLVISVALTGETTSRGAVRRAGARAGDWILVTGSLGGSIAGKHLTFTPRVREALALHERCELHAMIDVSDGFAADLSHILDESRCGAVVRAAAIPISDAARQMNDAKSPLEHALSDGEDFELLFTVDPLAGRRLIDVPPLGVPLSHIGDITATRGECLIESGDGTRERLEPRGYDHFRD